MNAENNSVESTYDYTQLLDDEGASSKEPQTGGQEIP